MNRVQRIIYNEQSTIYNEQRTIYNEQSTIYNIFFVKNEFSKIIFNFGRYNRKKTLKMNDIFIKSIEK